MNGAALSLDHLHRTERAIYDREVLVRGPYGRGFGYRHHELVSSASGWTQHDSEVEQITNQLLELAALNRGWDSYGALPPTAVAIEGAAWVAWKLHAAGLRAPQILATTDGGVRVEWSDRVREVSIEVDAVGRLSTYCFDESRGVEFEGSLDDPDEAWSTVLADLNRAWF